MLKDVQVKNGRTQIFFIGFRNIFIEFFLMPLLSGILRLKMVSP